MDPLIQASTILRLPPADPIGKADRELIKPKDSCYWLVSIEILFLGAPSTSLV